MIKIEIVNVLEEDESKYGMLAFCGVHVVAEFVGCFPHFLFETKVSAI